MKKLIKHLLNIEDIKKDIEEEIQNQFNDIYCGVELPKISKHNVMFFVNKAINMMERDLFYNKQLKEK